MVVTVEGNLQLHRRGGEIRTLFLDFMYNSSRFRGYTFAASDRKSIVFYYDIVAAEEGPAKAVFEPCAFKDEYTVLSRLNASGVYFNIVLVDPAFTGRLQFIRTRLYFKAMEFCTLFLTDMNGGM